MEHRCVSNYVANKILDRHDSTLYIVANKDIREMKFHVNYELYGAD